LKCAYFELLTRPTVVVHYFRAVFVYSLSPDVEGGRTGGPSEVLPSPIN